MPIPLSPRPAAASASATLPPPPMRAPILVAATQGYRCDTVSIAKPALVAVRNLPLPGAQLQPPLDYCVGRFQVLPVGDTAVQVSLSATANPVPADTRHVHFAVPLIQP